MMKLGETSYDTMAKK